MQVQDDAAGKQCKCPKCGALCQIPAAPAAEVPVQPVAAVPAAAPPAAAPPAAAPVAGKRPGGLTALAVLNFVFGGLGIIGGIFVTFLGGLFSSAGNMSDEFGKAIRQGARNTGDARAVQAANELVGKGADEASAFFYILGVFALITASLLIVAGVGYLKQSKKSGWLFGNIYGIAAIVITFLQVTVVGIGFGAFEILGLAYPIVTLALLNSVFKESFPNP